jgi:hypothetical protein
VPKLILEEGLACQKIAQRVLDSPEPPKHQETPAIIVDVSPAISTLL